MLGKLKRITVHLSGDNSIKATNAAINRPPRSTADINILKSASVLSKHWDAYREPFGAPAEVIRAGNQLRSHLMSAHSKDYDAEWERDTIFIIQQLLLALRNAGIVVPLLMPRKDTTARAFKFAKVLKKRVRSERQHTEDLDGSG